ncbi:RmlC-like cupin domain-containing protein [Linnemannia elongata]|nr:RmlC-like cupin domain-containing protein [Linnemannia elongata]
MWWTETSRWYLLLVLSREQYVGLCACVLWSIGRPESQYLDPFLKLDEFSVDKNGGFPYHPHHGFEAVTYMLEGQFQYEDFAGHKGTIEPRIYNGWTVGQGIIPTEILVRSQTHAHELQPYINLSKRHKMCKPQYQKLFDPHFPRDRPKDEVIVKVIVGELHSLRSQIYTRTIILHLDLRCPITRLSTRLSRKQTTDLFTSSTAPHT